MPLNVAEFKKLIKEINYNKQKINFLTDDFTNGFSIEYDIPTNVKMKSNNLRLNGIGNKTILRNKVMKEVNLKRFAGFFEEIAF